MSSHLGSLLDVSNELLLLSLIRKQLSVNGSLALSDFSLLLTRDLLRLLLVIFPAKQETHLGLDVSDRLNKP